MTERKPFFGFHNPTAKADVFKNTPEQNRFFDLSQIVRNGLTKGGQTLSETPWLFASLKFPSCIFCNCWSAILPCSTKLKTIYNNLILLMQTFSVLFWNPNLILSRQIRRFLRLFSRFLDHSLRPRKVNRWLDPFTIDHIRILSTGLKLACNRG